MTENRTYGTPVAVGRKKEFPERITLPLAAGKPQEIDSALREGEARVEFIREAIDAELKRRRAKK